MKIDKGVNWKIHAKLRQMLNSKALLIEKWLSIVPQWLKITALEFNICLTLAWIFPFTPLSIFIKSSQLLNKNGSILQITLAIFNFNCLTLKLIEKIGFLYFSNNSSPIFKHFVFLGLLPIFKKLWSTDFKTSYSDDMTASERENEEKRERIRKMPFFPHNRFESGPCVASS